MFRPIPKPGRKPLQAEFVEIDMELRIDVLDLMIDTGDMDALNEVLRPKVNRYTGVKRSPYN